MNYPAIKIITIPDYIPLEWEGEWATAEAHRILGQYGPALVVHGSASLLRGTTAINTYYTLTFNMTQAYAFPKTVDLSRFDTRKHQAMEEEHSLADRDQARPKQVVRTGAAKR